MTQNLSEAYYQFLSILANPIRVSILELLRNGPKKVGEISEALSKEQNKISQAIQLLEEQSFVFSETKNGKRLYSLNSETIEPLFKTLKYHIEKFCPGRTTCLTRRDIQEKKKKEASGSVSLTRQ